MDVGLFFQPERFSFYLAVGGGIIFFIWGLIMAGLAYYYPDGPFFLGLDRLVWVGIVQSLLGAAAVVTGHRLLKPHLSDD